MAWRDMIASIISASLEKTLECVGSEPGVCAEELIASADAVYTPLKPIDSGLGEARRIASTMAAVIANAFIEAAREKLGEEHLDFLKKTLDEARSKAAEAKSYAEEILEAAGLRGVLEPASSKEAREALLSDIEEYVEPPQPTIPRRRRSPRRPEPRARIRRLLREIGRRDPMLARSIAQILRSKGIEV